ncbi:DNA helicase [Tanacetum coccineum]
MFSMTSPGANIDTSINNGKGPYVFRISGQIYHWIGSMCPEEGNVPRFLQLYIYDTTNEVKNRMAHFGGEEQSGLKREIVEGLIDFLDSHNALIHDRVNYYSQLPRRGKLVQQYVVTAYCAIEQTRLDYIRQNQNDIRNEYLFGIYDAIIRGDHDGNDLGTRTILSISFTGGPRYMYAHYLDALAICRVHGNPSFFITFTCNAKWPKIQEYMDSWPELTTAGRADNVDHVFEQKVHDYIKFVRTTNLFGDITAVLYTIEFQKRGLPHCHSLLWGNFFFRKSNSMHLRPFARKNVLAVASSEHAKQRIQQFSSWLLDIGDGNIGEPDETDIENSLITQIPDELCIPDGDTAMRELINFVYDSQTFERPTAEDLQKKVIVCPKNETADQSMDVLSLNSKRFWEISLLIQEKQVPVKLYLRNDHHFKIQGSILREKSLEKIGIFLPEPVFAHGQLTMAESMRGEPKAADKGKLTLFEEEIINLKDIRATHTKKTIEVRVYRKWTAKNVKTKEASNFCCILLDKQGNAIQANMDLKDTDHFDELLQLNNAYRISRFTCTPTKKWQQTLDNKTTLNFGRYTSIEPIPNDCFPEHYFKFIAYNEVHDKADNNDALLTDYIGCIHRISDPIISGDATRSRKTRRIIDIQNLDGLNLPFVIWGEMVEKFDMDEYANMPKPVVIAVSSTWATTKYGGLQLTATPATHYYLNPDILEVHYILDVYAQFINPTESLEIQSQPCRTEEEEKMRNRYSIEALLNVNPQHYQSDDKIELDWVGFHRAILLGLSYDLNFDVVAAAVVEVKEESALLFWDINQGVEGMMKGNYGANEIFS